MLFEPWYPSNDDFYICGTQLLTKSCKREGTDQILIFENLKPADFALCSQLSSTAYSRYYSPSSVHEQIALLVESRLSSEILEKYGDLSAFEKNYILESQIRTVLNMVPVEGMEVLMSGNVCRIDQFDPLQPVEGL